jgi:hypothetical protein
MRVFNISHKRRACDSIQVSGKYYLVNALIENDPVFLWNAIHGARTERTNKCISLVRTDYARLKSAVYNKNPELVEDIERRYQQIKTKKKLMRDIQTGKICSEESKFRSLGKREVTTTPHLP